VSPDEVQSVLDGRGNWFGAKLLRLFAKADSVNLLKLSKAYPDEGRAFDDWKKAESRKLVNILLK
jgi:hypothetical protein|tara:strand:- start:1573 stop:1767 length:195 start_codon:yes stop_codon:yes gene_type:complete